MYVSFDNEIVLQCFTIIAQYIGCNLLCFATGIRLVQASLFLSTIDHGPTYLIGQHLLLHSTISTEERRKQAAYMPPPPLTSMIIRTMESVIIRAPRVQSYWRTFNVDHLITFGILSHHLTKLAFIEQESHIDARYVERSNVFASHNVRFRSCMFYTNMFICDYFRNSWLSKSTFVGRTNILLLLFVRQ